MDKAITKASSKDVTVISDDDEVSDHASSAVTHKTVFLFIFFIFFFSACLSFALLTPHTIRYLHYLHYLR